MMIRYASKDDLDGIFDLYKNYERDDILGLKIGINKDRITQSVIYNFHNVIIMIIDGLVVGAIVGNVVPCECTCDTVFMAMLLYVKRGFRRYTKFFLQEAEKLSKIKDATLFMLVAPNFEDRKKLERFYKMLGYKLLESHYIKKVV